MSNKLFFFAEATTFACKCGKTHHIPTQKTLLGKEVLPCIPQVLSELNLGKKLLLLFDHNTYEAAGRETENILKRASFEVIPVLLEKPPELEYLEPDERAREHIGSFLFHKPDFILAVGSGVINDLAKFVAHRIQIPYAVVATAPSMDGYSSPGAPMLVGGYKITYDATPPCAIFMDLEVLSRAPLPLIQAGFSDLVGKITANADWTIRNILQGEYFCEYTWELVKGAMEILRENAEEIGKRKEEAIYALAVALLNSGFSMTMVGDSRPASGAEHLVAHYLEIMALHRKMNPSLHGLRVGGATVIVKKMYDRFLQELEEIDWKKSENYSFTSQEEELKIHFGPLFPFIEKDAQEKLKWDREEMKIANPSLLYRQLQDKLSVIPDPASVLRRAQAPQTLEELGFSKKMIREALLFSRFIRKRVTILDLLGKAGLLKEYVDYALS